MEWQNKDYGGGIDQEKEVELRLEFTMLLAFFGRFTLFLLESCEKERGTRKRDGV